MGRLGLSGVLVCVRVGLASGGGVGGRGELAQVVAQGRGGGALLRQGRLQVAQDVVGARRVVLPLHTTTALAPTQRQAARGPSAHTHTTAWGGHHTGVGSGEGGRRVACFPPIAGWGEVGVASPVDEFGKCGSDLGPHLGQGGLLTAVELTDGGEAGGQRGGGLGQRGRRGTGGAGQQRRTQRIQLGMTRRLGRGRKVKTIDRRHGEIRGGVECIVMGRHCLVLLWLEGLTCAARSGASRARTSCARAPPCDASSARSPTKRHTNSASLATVTRHTEHRKQSTGASGSGQVARAIQGRFKSFSIHK